ncbi:MAG: MarR family winged helix-turn-helix transcriptional regulator [Dehalococcoidia bacterium]
MTINFQNENLALRLWFMIHRTHELLRTCEDQVFGNHKITTEQYTVLATMKYLEYSDNSVRPTDVARWLGRSPNSISMIADRMARAGLLKRVRDRVDRRVVHLAITSKGEQALKPATLAGLEFIQKILSPLSYEEKQTILNLLLKILYEAHKYLNPEADIEEVRKLEVKPRDNLMEGLVRYCCPEILKSNLSAKEAQTLLQDCCPQLLGSSSQSSKKRKTPPQK